MLAVVDRVCFSCVFGWGWQREGLELVGEMGVGKEEVKGQSSVS